MKLVLPWMVLAAASLAAIPLPWPWTRQDTAQPRRRSVPTTRTTDIGANDLKANARDVCA